MLSFLPQWRREITDLTIVVVISPLVVQDRGGGERRSARIISEIVIVNKVTLVVRVVAA